MNTKKAAKKYLTEFLKIAPLSHALWRASEAINYGQVKLLGPALDLGCGFGEFAGVVFNRIEMGIDVNEEELKQALTGKSYRKVKWADARKLPFKNSTFKTVLSVSVLEHIKGSEKVVYEASRVLRKHGVFIFSVPTTSLYKSLLVPKILNSLGLRKWGDKYFELHCLAFKHVNLKPAKWWVKHLKKANFEIIEQHGTLSPTLVKLHEFFLISAFPSQVWKLLFGKRLIMSVGLRTSILPIFFSRFVYNDFDSDINLFFIAKKK